MRFIGRKNELHTLNTEYNRTVALWLFMDDAVLEKQH